MKTPNNTKQYVKENTGLKPDNTKATRKKKRTIAKETNNYGRRTKA